MTNPAVVQPATGFGRTLAVEETSALRRLSPTRNRWREIAKFDAQTVELEQRRATLAAELLELEQRQIDAPNRHAQALAEWHLASAKGPRPESELSTIDARIAELREDVSGVDGAISTVLERKAGYVERHRERLAKEARRYVEEASDRYGRLIHELLAARDELLERRATELWATLYPAAAAGHAPSTVIAGGQSLRQVLGYEGQFNPGQIQKLLEVDREWAEHAASPEQRRLLLGKRDRREAVWAGTSEDLQQQRAERERQLGRQPSGWNE
jgi:hypothetical protein